MRIGISSVTDLPHPVIAAEPSLLAALCRMPRRHRLLRCSAADSRTSSVSRSCGVAQCTADTSRLRVRPRESQLLPTARHRQLRSETRWQAVGMASRSRISSGGVTRREIHDQTPAVRIGRSIDSSALRGMAHRVSLRSRRANAGWVERPIVVGTAAVGVRGDSSFCAEARWGTAFLTKPFSGPQKGSKYEEDD